MRESRNCAGCGVEIPANAPKGLCPKCLLQLGLRPQRDDASQAEAPANVGTRIRYFGDYELLAEIARGGMGVVYKARQISLNRPVAVKMILAGQLASEADVRRFHAEAQAAANLQHPNIVAIHEVGEHEGQHYFSMDYVEGKNLRELVREKPLPPERAASYVKTIATAIHYAHERGTLHRDLKPSNVIIDAFDEPRITDFGLAKRLRSGSEIPAPTDQLTLTGQVLGSPGFMSPEQAAGRNTELGPRSDVYSLGAILYYLLTGRPPFAAKTVEGTLIQVLNSEPTAPHLLNPSTPRDLETICLKCLEKEPGRRFASAQELGEELIRFRNNEPIVSRPVHPAERAWRWYRRNRAVAGLSVALGLVLLLGLSAAVWQWDRQWRAAAAQSDRWSARTVILDGKATNGVTYHVRLPQAYTPKRGLPGLVILHGANLNSKGYMEAMVAEWPKLAADYILIGINGERRTKDSPDDSPAYQYTYVNFVGKSKYKGFPGTYRESPALIAEVIDELKHELKITKLFVGGHSQGGWCTYSIFMNYPELFAGAFPMAGGLVLQAEPTAYTNAEIRAQQRRSAIAIIHSETDSTVDFSVGKAAYESFLDDSFPRVHLFSDTNAGHAFTELRVEQAVRWLEAMTSDDPVKLLGFAQERLAAGEYRDTTAAIARLRLLDTTKKRASGIGSVSQAIQAKAGPRAEALVQALRDAKDDSWVAEFIQFRAQFEFTDAAQEVMDLYLRLRADHQKPGEDLWWKARKDFGAGNRESAYLKCEEIVKRYYASTVYRYAKEALKERDRNKK